MPLMITSMKRLIAAGAVAGAVLGGGAIASAATSDHPAKPAAAAAVRHLGRRVVHGDLTVRTRNGFKEVVVDRGVLTSHDGTAIVVTPKGGTAADLTLTDKTRFRGITSAEQLQVGKPVVVLSTKDGHALLVAQRRPGAPGGNNDAAGSVSQ
jgi:hypothetical protein